MVALSVVLFVGAFSLMSNTSSKLPSTLVHAGISYTDHGTITINGNAQFNNSNFPEDGVVSGNGTFSNPYIIEGWNISAASASGIRIFNTNVYFIIRNCYVHDGGSSALGIYLVNCANGNITNNTVLSNSSGILLQSSSGNRVSDNTFNSNNNVGIYLTQSSNGNAISKNICNSNVHYGISIQQSSGNILRNNTCSSNDVLGIYLTQSSSHNALFDNICSSNQAYGIDLQQSSNNTLSNNNCSSNQYGIFLTQSSSNNNMTLNEMYNNVGQGVFIETGSNNMIWNNSFMGNSGGGIQANDDGTGNLWNTSGTPHGYGNYWSTLTGPDVDLDGIVDWSYNLTGSAGAKDYYPLARVPTQIPEFGAMPFVVIVFLAAILSMEVNRRRDGM